MVAVLQALRYKKGEEEPSAYTLGVMRAVACGAPRMQEHLFSAGQVDSARCPWCWEEVDETREDCYYHCSAWAAERMEHLGVYALDTSELPGITRSCGLVTVPPAQRSVELLVPPMQELVVQPLPEQASENDCVLIFVFEHRPCSGLVL